MRIAEVEVENFRCLRKVAFSCEPLTALIGANGTGKSSVLKTLEFFFLGRELDEFDCWGGDCAREVRVTVVFAELSPARQAQLRPWLDEAGRLRLTRVAASPGDGRRSCWYESMRHQVPEFQKVRQIAGATQLRAAYNELRAGPGYGDLPAVRSQAEAKAAMDAWEQAHPDLCIPLPDHTLTIGGGGEFDLGGMVTFVLVPAVRDAALDAESRTGGFRQLIEMLVRTRLDVGDQLEALREEVGARYAEIISKDGDTILAETSAMLSERLAVFAPGTAVQLRWVPHAITIDPPAVCADLVESNFSAEVGRQGHGVQRAYLVALLQALAEARAVDDATERPLLVLALEEPELYQHPIRARYLAGVLQRLALDPGGPATQVVYATHSPYFVAVDAVESLRLLRVTSGTEGLPEASVSSVDLTAAAAELWAAHGAAGACWTAASLRPRLRPMVETPVSEGFFAQAVVLLEGEEDRAVLAAAAAERDLDLAQRGIVLLPAGGKANLDRAIVLFRQLRIPTYVLFDADRRRRRDSDARSNRALLRLFGRPLEDFPDTQVHATFACFEDTLMDTVRSELGAEAAEAALAQACAHFGFTANGRKNGVVLRQALHELASEGMTSATLSDLIDQVTALA
jgi:hypothetical protein